jgi:hypothetical protein
VFFGGVGVLYHNRDELCNPFRAFFVEIAKNAKKGTAPPPLSTAPQKKKQGKQPSASLARVL